MRHRLFHAVVLVGVALPGCGSDDPASPPTDAATDTASAKDTAATTDSVAGDSADAVVVDSAPDTNEPDTCIDGCGPMCLPCIK